MPLPKPNADEVRADFVKRCLASEAARELAGTDEQRVAACERTFDDATKAAGAQDGYGMKAIQATVQGDTGKVRAIVATFDEVDNDGDVIVAGAVPDGTKVTVSAYNHDTVFNRMNRIAAPDAAPAGKGVIHIEGKHAIAEIDYFLGTQRGLEAFKTVQAMGADQTWSFAYHYDEPPQRATPEWAAKGATRMLTKLGPLLDGSMEVSPVKMPGNSNTGTLSAKAAAPTASVDGVEHPKDDFAYTPSEHPSDWKLPIFDADHVRNALARLSQAQIPPADLPDVKRRILAAAERFKVDAASLEAKKSAAETLQDIHIARAKRRVARR